MISMLPNMIRYILLIAFFQHLGNSLSVSRKMTRQNALENPLVDTRQILQWNWSPYYAKNYLSRPRIRKKRFFWGSSDDEKETTKVMIENPEITSTEGPGFWKSMYYKAKDAYKSTKEFIKKGVRKVKNATKRGAKKLMEKFKSGYLKIRKTFTRSDDKFSHFANNIKHKIDEGDEETIKLLEELGIEIQYDADGKLSSSVIEMVNVTDILKEHGFLVESKETEVEDSEPKTTNVIIVRSSTTKIFKHSSGSDMPITNYTMTTPTGITERTNDSDIINLLHSTLRPTSVSSVTYLPTNTTGKSSNKSTLHSTLSTKITKPSSTRSTTHPSITVTPFTFATHSPSASSRYPSTKKLTSTTHLATKKLTSITSTMHPPTKTTTYPSTRKLISTTSTMHSPTKTTVYNPSTRKLISTTSTMHPPTKTTIYNPSTRKLILTTSTMHPPTKTTTYNPSTRKLISTTSTMHPPTKTTTYNPSTRKLISTTSTMHPPTKTTTYNPSTRKLISTTSTMHQPTKTTAYLSTTTTKSPLTTTTTLSPTTHSSITTPILSPTKPTPPAHTDEPPPFPDIFGDSKVRDRLHEVFLNSDFSHDDLRTIFDFDPALYEDDYFYYN